MPKNLNVKLPTQIVEKKNSLIEVFLLLVVCGLFFKYLIMPKQAALEIMQAESAVLQTKADSTAGLLKKLQDLTNNLNKYPKEFSELDQALPLDGKAYKLQLLLETLAQSVNVTIGSINIGETKEDAWAGNREVLDNPFKGSRALGKLTGSIYVFGSYDQITAFLEKLQNSGRIVNINSIGMESGKDGALNLQITFESYYLMPIAQ